MTMMARLEAMRRSLALLVVLALSAGACTGDDGNRRSDEPAPDVSPSQGGVLRVVVPRHDLSTLSSVAALDPQVDWWNDSFEVFRCCLLRTLLAHPGLPTDEGGSELHPDLASGMPEVSADGLTWTFHLKRGIRYGPPLQDTKVVAADIIRALEREAAVGPDNGTYYFYYEVIEGFRAMVRGDADTISGVEAPDDSTLIVHLTRPAGYLANLFALPATAPIPPSGSATPAGSGVADGIGEYGRFLVATGPYMIEGSEDLDLSAPPDSRAPISGYQPGRSLTLVRNPSWDPQTDPLRPAYVDRIELTLGPRIGEAVGLVERGEADLYIFDNPAPQIPVAMVERFLDHPELGIQVKFAPRDMVRYIPLNLAVPPLDDLHVRRAISYAIDRSAMLELRGGSIIGEVASHIVPDSMENGLLASYEPYPTSLADARAEMALSRYDEDGDGRCDAEACQGLVMQAAEGYFPQMTEMAEMIRQDLEAVGIELRVEIIPAGPGSAALDDLGDPAARLPMATHAAWGADFLNASTFIGPMFGREGIPGYNYPLVGARPRQLRGWGYDVTSVPSIDERIDECMALIGDLQVRCWAESDQYLMEHVVPWVPYVFEKKVFLVSDRVDAYSLSQVTTSPALDRLSVSSEAS